MNCTCLIVDDDPFQCKLLAHQLGKLGANPVQSCPSATELLERLDRGEVPDLLILDLNLPGMDGIEVLRHLANRNYRGELVLVSGEEESTLASAARLATSLGLRLLGRLTKPVSPDDLAAVLVSVPPHKNRPAAKTYRPEEVARAIAANQLTGFYQPKVRVADRRVVGTEYLVRWRHPADGWVFPDQFVPVAEAAGLIGDLTAAVLSDALQQLGEWRRRGLSLKLAVNVAMDDLADPAFADQVLQLCQTQGVAPDALVLEVTESRLEYDSVATLEALGRLHLRHVRLSIDDFGTGHSSLARLRDLPFDELKIDRSFTHRAWEDPRRLAIFQTSLDLARRLGLEVVAEGVEDEADWHFLEQQGCSLAQGYHIARPLPAAEFSRWLQDRTAGGATPDR